MSKEEVDYIDKQITAALNLIAVLAGGYELTHYPMLRDVLIPHKELANKVVETKDCDLGLFYHAHELLTKLETLNLIYNNKIEKPED